jgi:hypothetical protein
VVIIRLVGAQLLAATLLPFHERRRFPITIRDDARRVVSSKRDAEREKD